MTSRHLTTTSSLRIMIPVLLLTAALAQPVGAQSLTIVSPHAGEQINSQFLYHIRWSASGVPVDAQFAVSRINGIGEEVGVCVATAAERSCEWFQPDLHTSALFVELRNSGGDTLVRVQAAAFAVVSGGTTSLPNLTAWDIGDVGRSGGTLATGDTSFRVRGAGGDVWGTADAFHYAWIESHFNDSNATFTIAGLDGTHRWTKAGVMMRENALPGSPHHFVLASRSMGLAYQRRLTQDGESLHTSLSPSSGLPVTISVMRRNNYVEMDFRQGDGPWQRAAQFAVGGQRMLGMAVTSHDTSALATGHFTDVQTDYIFEPTVQISAPAPEMGEDAITAGVPYTIRWGHSQPVNRATVSYSVDGGHTWAIVPRCQSIDRTTCLWQNPGPATETARLRVQIEDPNDRRAWHVTWPFAIRAAAPGILADGWASRDVGAVAAPGSASYDTATGQFIVEGSGADVWGSADAFHFASTPFDRWAGEDDFDVTVRVTSVQNVHRWTKAGIMLRSGTDAGAPHAFLFATPTTEKGLAFQRRIDAGGASGHTAGPSIAPHVWLKLIVRSYGVYAFYRHHTTDPWTFIGSDILPFLGGMFEVGLAVTSHQDGTLARATFDHFSLQRQPTLGYEDIGSVGVPGETRVYLERVALRGSGADIWNTADSFRYHRGLFWANAGRATLSARVRSLEPTHRWAKAGVMYREDESPGSRHVMLIVSAERGIAMQYRDVAGGISKDVAIVPGTAPVWLRLERQGSLFIGEASTDGLTWWEVGRLELPMAEPFLAGLAVTSHNNSVLTTAVFDDIVIRP